ncbi:MAG: response regulator transcription factor [Thermoguttaceae bacterium]|jgi:two-component system phosphate regulon response regulator PhoB
MMKKSVLIVEDDEDIRELVSYHLLKEGYQVAGVASGEEALALAEAQPPDLILLDIMLPGMDGMAVCQKLRASPKAAATAIMMLTAKGEETDIVRGLNLGANDYVTKPFSPKVLLARVRAVLRRGAVPAAPAADPHQADRGEVIEIHDLVIHPGRHEVRVEGKVVPLSSTEFRVLQFLASRPGWVFSRQQILDGVHGDNYAITDRAVDVQIVGLRKKLGSAGRYIETVRGVGYRFKE